MHRERKGEETAADRVVFAYQLHQLEDAGYGLEVGDVQPDAGEGIRLARLGLHRRRLARIVAGVVAGTVHRHHGLRHHVTPAPTPVAFFLSLSFLSFSFYVGFTRRTRARSTHTRRIYRALRRRYYYY